MFSREEKLLWGKIGFHCGKEPFDVGGKHCPVFRLVGDGSTTVPAGLSPKCVCTLLFDFRDFRPIHPMAISFNE